MSALGRKRTADLKLCDDAQHLFMLILFPHNNLLMACVEFECAVH